MDGQEPTKAVSGQEPTTTTPVSGNSQEPKPATQPQAIDANTPVNVADLPANVQKLIGDLRQENATHRKAKESAETEAQKAKETQMKEQEQWKELAEERGKQLDGLKAKAADFDKLAPILSKQLQDEINAWPEKVRNLFPAEEMSLTEMMAWAGRFRPLALEMAGDTTPAAGNGRRPTPAAPAGTDAREKETRAQQGAWTRTQF